MVKHPWVELWTNNGTQMELTRWHKLRLEDITLNRTNPATHPVRVGGHPANTKTIAFDRCQTISILQQARNHDCLIGDHVSIPVLNVNRGVESGIILLEDRWCSKAIMVLHWHVESVILTSSPFSFVLYVASGNWCILACWQQCHIWWAWNVKHVRKDQI